MKKIKVMLADDNDQIRESVKKLLELDNEIDLVAEAANGREVIEKIPDVEPEVVVMDINMPEMDGLEACRHISENFEHIAVIIISVEDEPQSFSKAMRAGAKGYLVKPLSPLDLNNTVKEVAELNRKRIRMHQPEPGAKNGPTSSKRKNKLVTIFGTKGGVGKSVICTNLAVALAQKYKNQVGVVDLDIQFGDVSIMMNISPRKTIAELMQEGEILSRDLLEDYIYERKGVHILTAPNKPELAELVTADKVGDILNLCREMYTYTVVDTPSFIDETTLTALEKSDLILLIISLDLPTIKNVKKGIDILRSLKLLNKTRLILNRSSGVAGIEAKDVEKVLDMKIRAEVPSDGKLVISSLNQGIPFIDINSKAPISKGIMTVMQLLEEDGGE